MIEVLTAGLFSSIQDLGRFGFRHLGVPIGGAMDQQSARLANSLLNNQSHCALIEMTINGPLLKFHSDTFIAISGADFLCFLNDKTITTNTPIAIKAGDVLKVGTASNGIRGYIAVSGGLKSEKIFNSRSMYQGITQNTKLIKGSNINIEKIVTPIINRTRIKTNSQYFKQQKVSVSKGPEFDLLDENTQATLLKRNFQISNQSNRMAYKLKSTNQIKGQEIITSAVQPGTVQLTPSGEIIVLMRDCQTTGGYSRILQLTESAINQVAQKTAQMKIIFGFVE